MKIILASKSPFRKHALDVLGLKYQVIPSDIDEKVIRHKSPAILTQLLSQAKARKIGEKHKNAIIIAADLFVVNNNKILEKPQDERDAKRILRMLSNKNFRILAGLSVYNSQTKKMLSTCEICKVHFRNLSNFEISDYVSRYPATKCAGAFEADGLLRFADRIEGSYNFMTAIPVDKLILFLRKNKVIV